MICAMNAGAIFGIVFGIIAAIALFAFLLYRFLRPKMKIDDKPGEQDIVNEEMNRVLRPIEDDDTAKAVNEYKDDDE